VRARSAAPIVLCLAARGSNQNCNTPAATIHELSLPLPAVELEMPHGLPLSGAKTVQLKAVGERRSEQAYEVDFEALGGSQYELPVRLNRPGVIAGGGEISDGHLRVRFPEGAGYQRRTVRFSW
jgi:hypothetical protein